MTQKITKVTVQKNRDRVNLYDGESFIIGIDKELFSEQGLGVGTELTDELLKTLKSEDEVKKALNKAYRYLSYRPRSEYEVRQKLLEKYPEEVVETALMKLKKLHYVDDDAFVSFWVEARGTSRGPALLRSELLKKGISKPLIDGSLNKNEEKLMEEAVELIASKRRYQGINKDDFYKKAAPFLARRGYNYEIIKKVIKQIYQ